jgi:hypothetical protein
VFEQVDEGTHAPVALQVETPFAFGVHIVEPGVHSPWQDADVPFDTHAEALHATGAPHMPVESHV